MSYIDDQHNSNPGLSGSHQFIFNYVLQIPRAIPYHHVLPVLTGINSSTLAPHRSSGSEAINIGIKSSKQYMPVRLNRSAAPPYFTIRISELLLH